MWADIKGEVQDYEKEKVNFKRQTLAFFYIKGIIYKRSIC